MIGDFIAQLVGTAVASKKKAIGLTLTRIALVLIGVVFVIAAFGFILATIYHVLTPTHFTRAEAAGLIAIGLLVLGGILVAVALKAKPKPKLRPSAAAADTPDPQSAELLAIQALGTLNKALTDIGKSRGGASPYLGLLGIAALVGFVSGRKR